MAAIISISKAASLTLLKSSPVKSAFSAGNSGPQAEATDAEIPL
jgi:hypothetical protein